MDGDISAAQTPLSPERAVADLAQRVLTTVERSGTEGRRAAYLRLLEALDVSPGDLFAWTDGTDVLGTVYERLFTGAQRRASGQFQTPFFAADLMAALLLRQPTDVLLDPGAGSGRLLFRAARRTDPPARLLGFDTDPVGCAMAEQNLRLHGLADRSEIRQTDFLLDEVQERPDAIICNPPYSRHHSLAPAVKAAIHEGFERRIGLRVSRLASLHALFLLRSLEVLRPGGSLIFITPADWLDVGYGASIKRHVLSHASVEAIVLFSNRTMPFGPGVMSSAAITLIRKHGEGDTAAHRRATTIVRLPKQLPSVEKIVMTLDGGPRCRGLTLKEMRLTAQVKWCRPRSSAPRGKSRRRLLGEMARVRRGIATGANRFFVISDDGRREHQLPKRVLRPCIATPRLVTGLELTDETLSRLPSTAPRWALSCRNPAEEHKDTSLGRYLRHGRAQGVSEGYLASHRDPWYALEQRDRCEILFTYFNRSEPRFVRNRAGAVPLNTFLIIEPNTDVDADWLWQALNTIWVFEQLRAKRRDYAGMWKVEPRELGAIAVPL